MMTMPSFRDEASGRRPTSARPVDLAHLSRVTFGDRSLEREVLHLFQRQSLALVERMRAAADVEAFAIAAHTLKGSARGIGAFPTAEAAEAAELAIGAGDAAVTAAFHAVIEAVDTANAAIRDLIATH
jgi:HPt (histidine-containing phosphotransfer) domain-containing protein